MTGVIIGVTAVVTTVIVACCFLFGLLIGFGMCENAIRKELDSGKIPKVVEECMLTNNRDKFKDIFKDNNSIEIHGVRTNSGKYPWGQEVKEEEPQPAHVDYKDFEAYERGEK